MKMTLLLLVCCLGFLQLRGQTIEEKRAAATTASHAIERRVSKELRHVNGRYAELQDQLRALYAQVPLLRAEGAEEDLFEYLVEQMREVRHELAQLQEDWQRQACSEDRSNMYALMHQPWTTLEQLIIDYGADDHIYLIPPDIGAIRLSVASNLPVPRECFDDLLQLLLRQNGIGVRSLSPLLRELYWLSASPTFCTAITADRTDLSLMRPLDRICFVLQPPAAQAAQLHALLEKFVDSNTFVFRLGRQIFITALVETLQELLKIYDFADAGTETHQYQMVSLNKLSASEMASIVKLYFDVEGENISSGLKVWAPAEPANALFLAGSSDMVRQARKLIEGVESQIADPKEMVVYTYTVRHSDVEELAQVMGQVYALMQSNPTLSLDDESIQAKLANRFESVDPNVAIDPKPITTRPSLQRDHSPSAIGNIVVSAKTGTLIMVVEHELLPQFKSLLRKLDVPKRMVRIDVLLFEKRITDQSRFGLDLLRVGSTVKEGANRVGCQFSGGGKGRDAGILQFLVSHVKERLSPAFDVAYDFLMSREDIRINASPSVMAVNNTEAKIELVEEISIDNGTYVDSETKKRPLQRSYTRTQYGITIAITPSINSGDQGWPPGPDYITLDTSVLFDTPRPSQDDRPPVIRRRITNQVRIPNGQTVVLGGLRSKMSEDTDSGLPFLSEIPYFGKIFGSSRSADRDTEMFIFITPTIVEDPASDLAHTQRQMMCRRPGDLPEFLQALDYARDRQKRLNYEQTLKALFGRKGACDLWAGS